MVDVRKPATLRGFNVSIADVGDRMRLCHPLLSFKGDSSLYIAHKLGWQDDPEALAITDPDEASQLGTLFPETHGRLIASGEGVVAVGAGFAQAAAAAKVQFPGAETPLAQIDGSECLIGTATSAIYTKLRTRLVDQARRAFDDELGDAARHKRHLSERGNAALLLLRRCGPLRREDLAIRQLAGARQNQEIDLYRRLLIRFELELDVEQDDLHRKVDRHIELAISPLPHTTVNLVPMLEKMRRSVLLDSNQGIEDTPRIDAAVVEVMLEATQAIDDALNPEALRGCVGAASEQNLKEAKDVVEEIRRLITAMKAPDSPDISRVDAHRPHAMG